MTEEMKVALFEKMLEFETLAEKKTNSSYGYFEQSEGAYAMLKILGITDEYIKWSYGREAE